MYKHGELIKRTQVRFRIDHPGTVCGIAKNADDRILLVAVQRELGHQTWEVPGGVVEEGETRDEALIREFVEETGILPQEYSVLYSFTTAVGLTNEIVSLYDVGHWQQETVEKEHEIRWVDEYELEDLVINKNIVDCKTIIAILHLKINR